MSQGVETRDREPQEASTDPQDDVLVVGGHRFSSRLLVGTGKYASNEEMNECLEVSGCEVVTVAVRRAHLDDPGKSLAKHLDRETSLVLGLTALVAVGSGIAGAWGGYEYGSHQEIECCAMPTVSPIYYTALGSTVVANVAGLAFAASRAFLTRKRHTQIPNAVH